MVVNGHLASPEWMEPVIGLDLWIVFYAQVLWILCMQLGKPGKFYIILSTISMMVKVGWLAGKEPNNGSRYPSRASGSIPTRTA